MTRCLRCGAEAAAWIGGNPSREPKWAVEEVERLRELCIVVAEKMERITREVHSDVQKTSVVAACIHNMSDTSRILREAARLRAEGPR